MVGVVILYNTELHAKLYTFTVLNPLATRFYSSIELENRPGTLCALQHEADGVVPCGPGLVPMHFLCGMYYDKTFLKSWFVPTHELLKVVLQVFSLLFTFDAIHVGTLALAQYKDVLPI